MKNVSYFFIIFLFTTFVLLQGCKKDISLTKTEELTSQVQKIETIYKDGDIKNEFLYVEGAKKIETSDDASIIEELKNASTQRLYKQTTRLKTLGYDAAVFKSSNCKTANLQIFLDNEDSNNNTHITGWVGSSYKDSKGNLTLNFCACNSNQFTNLSTSDFGILQIDWANVNFDDDYISKIEHYIDCEDTRNANKAYFNGASVVNTDKLFPTKITDNAILHWIIFKQKDDGVTSLPYTSIADTYGVLGDLNKDWVGFIYSDDEDNKNRNYIKYNDLSATDDNVPFLIDLCYDHFPTWPKTSHDGENTKMYISQILNGVPQI